MKQIVKKIYRIFSPRDRKQLVLLLIPMSMAAVLNVIGIAFVAPFMAVVSNPEMIKQSHKLSLLYHYSHCSTPHRFLLFLGFMVLAILVLGNSFSAITTWLNIRFANRKGHAISYRLFQKYLSQPYIYFLNKNSSSLSKTIFSDASVFVSGIIIPGMQLITNLVAIVFILALLFYVRPMLMIALVLILGGAYSGIYYLLRKILARVNKRLVETQEQRFRITNEAFGGIKDIKLLNNSEHYLKRFFKDDLDYADNSSLMQVMSALPRYVLETIAFGGIIIITLYLLATQKSTSQVVPMLALYAFAGYRLMPALQTVFSSFTMIKAREKSLDVLYEDLCKQNLLNDFNPKKTEKKCDFTTAIEFKNFSFAYPNTNKNVIKNLNLQIPINSTIGFVGTTGSGKTTAIDLLLGLLQPQKGQLIVDGKKITAENLVSWQNILGYVPQQIYLADDTVIKNIAFGVNDNEINFKAVEKAAKMANIHDFIVSEMANSYSTIVGERGVRLSGGQRQRIGIARALYRDPEVLILDEATSALDSETESAIMEAIHKLATQKTLIIIAHRVTTLKECNTIYCLEKGKIVANGNYENLVENYGKL